MFEYFLEQNKNTKSVPLARTFKNKRILGKWVFEGLNKFKKKKCRWRGPLKKGLKIRGAAGMNNFF